MTDGSGSSQESAGAAPSPGWRLFQPLSCLHNPCAQQHVNSAQANTQLLVFFAMCRSQARLPHIQLLLLLAVYIFPATWEGWSNVSSADGEMGQSQMTGTFHRLGRQQDPAPLF